MPFAGAESKRTTWNTPSHYLDHEVFGFLPRSSCTYTSTPRDPVSVSLPREDGQPRFGRSSNRQVVARAKAAMEPLPSATPRTSRAVTTFPGRSRDELSLGKEAGTNPGNTSRIVRIGRPEPGQVREAGGAF